MEKVFTIFKLFSIDCIRDENIAKTIVKLFKEHNRILIVYGAGHLIELDRLLVKMLAKPVLEVANQSKFNPVSDKDFRNNKIHNKNYKNSLIIQIKQSSLDIFIIKNENKYFVRHYKYYDLLGKKLNEFEFESLRELNEDLKKWY
ncbi:MAG: hypothetical protein ABIA04_07850 [Pseudomonadota bacterium]